VTAPAEPVLTLAPQWDATLTDLARLNDDIAEWAEWAVAGGDPLKWVIARMIYANRLIAKGVRGEPVTP
jgi:hypothetical protein